MKAFQRVVMAVSITALFAGSAVAEMSAETVMQQDRQRLPVSALVAAGGNVLYAPIRLGITAAAAELGGLTGFLTAGNQQAAEDVREVFEGQAMLTRAIVQGEEPLRFGAYEYQLLLVTPGH